MKNIINILATCAIFFTVSASANVSGIERTTVWASGHGSYKVYRIPSLIVSAKETLLAFCEGRPSASDTGSIDLIVKRSSDCGRTFGRATVVWSDPGNTCGNPCPVVDRSTGVIWLLMTHNFARDGERQLVAGTAKLPRTVWITHSADDGVSWAKPREITASVSEPAWAWYATGPGIGIQIRQGKHAGRLIIPCDHTLRGGGARAGFAHVIYSDDHGASWKLGGSSPQPGFNESQIAEISGGRLMLNMRNNGSKERTRGVCISEDGGETFADLHHDLALIEPVCQASILRLDDTIKENATTETQRRGDTRGEKIDQDNSPRLPPRLNASAVASLLFANPASKTKRINMTVRLSRDDGATWPIAKTVFAGPSGYSCLAQLPDGSIALLYECGEHGSFDRIELARFSLDWLIK